jgi:hypothetical protein
MLLYNNRLQQNQSVPIIFSVFRSLTPDDQKLLPYAEHVIERLGVSD